MSASPDPERRLYGGLCERCKHMKIVRSERGSRFLMCARSRSDKSFAKYPPQPVISCLGWEEYAGVAGSGPDGSRHP